MAKSKITLSELAPNESTHFSFPAGEFDLVGKKVYSTDNLSLIADAETHEWLSVEHPTAGENPLGGFREQLAPKDDHLSALGSSVNPNDPDEAAAAEAAKLKDEGVNVSIDVNKDQSETVVIDALVAETLAADTTSKTSKTKDKD